MQIIIHPRRWWFGVKYSVRADMDHLNNALQTKYTTPSKISGRLYCGLILKYDYQLQYIDISIPGYVNNVLKRFITPFPLKPHHSPYAHLNLWYGVWFQYTPHRDTSPCLSLKETTTVQKIIDTLLHYTRSVDLALHVTLGRLDSLHMKPIEYTYLDIKHLLRYFASHTCITISYHASDTVLHVNNDVLLLDTFITPFRIPLHISTVWSISTPLLSNIRFLIYLQLGSENYSDYFTTYSRPSHHRKVHPVLYNPIYIQNK